MSEVKSESIVESDAWKRKYQEREARQRAIGYLASDDPNADPRGYSRVVPLSEIRAFKVNECDWVAAQTLDDAIAWYLIETGLPRDEAIEDEHESPLSLPMFADEDRSGTPTTTVGALIKEHAEQGYSFPCTIASTEY